LEPTIIWIEGFAFCYAWFGQNLYCLTGTTPRRGETIQMAHTARAGKESPTPDPEEIVVGVGRDQG